MRRQNADADPMQRNAMHPPACARPLHSSAKGRLRNARIPLSSTDCFRCCHRRNQTLAWGGGGLLVLYLANGLLNQIDRLPLLPQFLQLVGFAFSSWFAFRCAWGPHHCWICQHTAPTCNEKQCTQARAQHSACSQLG